MNTFFPRLLQFHRAHQNRSRIAISSGGHEITYGQLLSDALKMSDRIRSTAGGAITGERVAYMVPANYINPVVQWGIWMSGGVGVSLGLHSPSTEIAYFLRDSAAKTVVSSPAYAERVDAALPAGVRHVVLDSDAPNPGSDEEPRPSPTAELPPKDGAYIVYTSGTTGAPKGVYTTHLNLQAQLTALHDLWGWTKEDRALNVLPLHHVHGVMCVLNSALYAGAACEMHEKFDAKEVWKRFLDQERPKLSVFMAVPTVYHKLTQAHGELFGGDPRKERAARQATEAFRLMVSGSAALPDAVMQRWERLSGQRLLERYGMSEFGMALSNPLDASARTPGLVGKPVPGMQVRLSQAKSEIEVRGDAVFGFYWGKPEATREAFTEDGWFRTGDVGEWANDESENGASMRILGRESTDILKSGGYKLSALEIERALLEHPRVAEAGVVGQNDEEMGEKVVAFVVLHPQATVEERTEVQEEIDSKRFAKWCEKHLAKYKIPREVFIIPEMPRNAMGKINKKKLKQKVEI